jgi:hypothetical protein
MSLEIVLLYLDSLSFLSTLHVGWPPVRPASVLHTY